MKSPSQQWLDAENAKLSAKKGKRLPWITRGYVHFDARITPSEALPLVTDARQIENHKFTPLLSFEKKLRRYRYKNDPERKVKVRLLSYASHCDAYIYSWYAFQLYQQYEQLLVAKGLSKCITAYRAIADDDEKRSTVDFANEVFEHVRSRGECAAVTLDIKDFFGQIQHKYLKARWSEVIEMESLPDDHYAVFRSLTKYVHVMQDDVLKALGVKRKELGQRGRLCSEIEYYRKVKNAGHLELNPNYLGGRGIPQGTPISGLLSNLYLWQFDRDLLTYVKNMGGIYRRYCDDIVIVCDISKADECADVARKLIESTGLEIQPEKTEVTYFRKLDGSSSRLYACRNKEGFFVRKPLQYLGFEFEGEHSFLRSSTIARFMRKMKRHVDKQVRIRKKALLKARSEGRSYSPQLNQKKILSKFSHLGSRNLLSYARRADERQSEISNIPKQLKKLDKKVKAEIGRGQKELDSL